MEPEVSHSFRDTSQMESELSHSFRNTEQFLISFSFHITVYEMLLGIALCFF